MPGFTDALKEHGLELVGQVHTTSDVSSLANFKYCTKYSVEDHLASLKELATIQKEAGAFMINSHSGCDSWSIAEAKEYLAGALKIEKELGIPICHETHRRRIFWQPYNFRDILKDDESLKDVKCTLDISHWVVCLERIFATEESGKENGEGMDYWWPEILEMLKQRTGLIHGRVGYGEGPQVPDPEAAEYAAEVKAHWMYWDNVIKGMLANKVDINFEGEFGPWPYQHSVPHNETKPNHDIWKSNNFICQMMRDRWPTLLESLK